MNEAVATYRAEEGAVHKHRAEETTAGHQAAALKEQFNMFICVQFIKKVKPNLGRQSDSSGLKTQRGLENVPEYIMEECL